MFAQASIDWNLFVPIVFVLISILSYLWTAFNQVRQQRNRSSERGERPLPTGGQAQGQPPPLSTTPPEQAALNAEIEEFLRRTNERRTEKGRRAGQTAPPRHQPTAVSADKSPSDARRRKQTPVSQSVEQHLGSHRFESREQRVADKDARSEPSIAQHVQQAFDHQLGSLASSGAEGSAAANNASTSRDSEQKSTALNIVGLLMTEENLRQAVILREILERPEDRW